MKWNRLFLPPFILVSCMNQMCLFPVGSATSSGIPEGESKGTLFGKSAMNLAGEWVENPIAFDANRLVGSPSRCWQ